MINNLFSVFDPCTEILLICVSIQQKYVHTVYVHTDSGTLNRYGIFVGSAIPKILSIYK